MATTFTVTLKTLDKEIIKMQILAASREEAIKQALVNSKNYMGEEANLESAKAVRIAHDPDYWRQQWWQALQNMTYLHVLPFKSHPSHTYWVTALKGKVPLPLFIKRLAQGTMEQNRKGEIRVKLHPYTKPDHLMAKVHVLATLLHYKGFYGKPYLSMRPQLYKTWNWWPVMRGLAFGVEPKGEKRELLLKLASSEGADLARQLYENRDKVR